MSDSLLSEFRTIIATLLKKTAILIQVLGGVILVISIFITLMEIRNAKNNIDRSNAIIDIKWKLVGSYMLGSILSILGFLTHHFM